jgi:hypothetical protein
MNGQPETRNPKPETRNFLIHHTLTTTIYHETKI